MFSAIAFDLDRAMELLNDGRALYCVSGGGVYRIIDGVLKFYHVSTKTWRECFRPLDRSSFEDVKWALAFDEKYKLGGEGE